ncbi:MAG: hypothetical protein M1594_00050 [Candidatus Marsarchaeota archaeon]|nr:hypothetical protein [Candidatus Marsarchaeota archaeon]
MDVEVFKKSVSRWEVFLWLWSVLFFVFIYLYYFSSFVFLGLSDWDLYFLAFLGFVPLYVGFSENLRVGFPVFFLLASLACFVLGSFFDFIFFVYFVFSVVSFVFYDNVWRSVEEERIRKRDREWDEKKRVELDESRRFEEERRLKMEKEVDSRVAEVLNRKLGLRKASGELSRRERRIMREVQHKGFVNVKWVMELNKVSKRAAVYDLNVLISRGLVKRSGSGRSTIYVSS